MDPHADDPSNDHDRFNVTTAMRRVLFLAIAAPFNLFFTLLKKSFSLLRPYSSHLIPLFVCLVLVPLLIIFSVSAGWVVWSTAAANWEVPLYLQYGDGSSPYAYTALPQLIPQQRYDIAIDLSVPLTEANLALGNFMTTLTLMTVTNKTLVIARKPAIILRPPKSYFKDQTLTQLDIPVITSFIPGTSAVTAFVEIGRKDRWTTIGAGQGQELSIIAASLHGHPVHHGIRGLVSRYPFVSSVFAAVLFLIILLSVLGMCLLPMVLYGQEGGEEASQTGSPALPVQIIEPSDEDEHPAKRIKRSRSAGSPSRRINVKTEPQAVPIPSTSSPSNPLRKRRSRLMDSEESDA
ncbi:hypothetical protein AX16_006471 [Volvariella volvacea WC 439]|nr:hypothetical protein AX16_006471 [Volvariella volvacea WC 439]